MVYLPDKPESSAFIKQDNHYFGSTTIITLQTKVMSSTSMKQNRRSSGTDIETNVPGQTLSRTSNEHPSGPVSITVF